MSMRTVEKQDFRKAAKLKALARVIGLGKSIKRPVAYANSDNFKDWQQLLKVFLKLAPTPVFEA